MTNVCAVFLLCFTAPSFGYTFFQCESFELSQFEAYLTNIAQTHTGCLLLDKLEDISNNTQKLIIKKSEKNKTYLQVIKSTNEAFLYLSDCTYSYVGCPCSIKNIIKIDEHSVWPIGDIPEPYYLVVAHELIHYLHYLTNPGIFMQQKLSEPIHWQKYYKNSGNSHTRQCGNIYRYRFLFCNAEEERTVLGWFNPNNELEDDGISESRIMIEAGFYPRYAYQEHNRSFYECAEILQNIFKFFNFNAENRSAEKFESNTEIDPQLNVFDVKCNK